MRYAIITNPVSGKMTAEQKRAALAQAAEILDTEIHGLDTTTAEEFGQCARELATRCDVLVAAGGDGTFSDIILIENGGHQLMNESLPMRTEVINLVVDYLKGLAKQ